MTEPTPTKQDGEVKVPIAASAAPVTQPGVVMLAEGVYADILKKAEEGAQALAFITKQRRDGIISAALSEGRIAPADEPTWRTSLERDEPQTVALLQTLPKAAAFSTQESGSDAALSDASAIDQAHEAFRRDFLRLPSTQTPAATAPQTQEA